LEAAKMEAHRNKELYGDYYENRNKNKPLLVIIGGSKSGIPTIGDSLFDYFKLNYNVLVLAYFGVEKLPKNLERIPLEYFINAISYFKGKLNITDNGVVLVGSSKGGELVLLLISKSVNSSIAIACVPSCYVFQAIPNNIFSIMFPRSSWTIKNREIPFVKFRFNKEILRDIRNKIYLSCYEKSIELNKNARALINIDNYKGKLLLISAEIDQYWPSKEMCNRLAESGNRNNIQHIVLDVEGHYLLEYEKSSNEIIKYLESNAPSGYQLPPASP
jgi:uncharacterized protein